MGYANVRRGCQLAIDGHYVSQLDDGDHGAALYPTVESIPAAESLSTTADRVYPVLVREFTTVGFKGIVVAGILAAAISTYAGMSAAMSALLTRDVYARLIARDRPDRHYVRVGRWMTLAVALGSFLYVPFLLQQGMMSFYLELVATFVVPLLTVYLMGVFTPVHRKSGTIGLVVGMAYGIWRIIAVQIATTHGVQLLPTLMLDSFVAYPVSLAITAGAMLAVSLALGFEPRGPLLHAEACRVAAAQPIAGSIHRATRGLAAEQRLAGSFGFGGRRLGHCVELCCILVVE